MMNIDSIIFDLDGTLWDSTGTILKAWNKIICETDEIHKPITKEQIQGIMGLQMLQIAEKLMPYLNADKQIEMMKRCYKEEDKFIKEEGGILYPQLEETIQKLSQRYQLFIVSNCQCGYIEAFLEYNKFNHYFTDFECAENTELSKGENIKEVIRRNGLKSPIYVGDTQGDCDASRVAQIPFVYASYGFGKVNDYDYVIENFEDILRLV